jgi:hypothetical protein
MMTLVIGGLGSLVAVFGVLFVINYLREGRDSSRSAERTTESITGVVTGVTLAGVALSLELVGAIITTVLTAPESLATLALGVIGYLSLDGVLSVTPETWALLVIIGFVLATAGRDLRGINS